ncbi:NAD-dependent epimerase/dehydratase [Bacillus methanolicus PB1]|uniref:NAD-dependent epimerase/dehydratase n=1 Tax=Bacillus methanolicus PB1 TaxID=997296 RepID=I3E4C7_BACMT|nr:GDP-mannose 4,6-dehydratase [Bacillus methanolicus]EIJ81348.1 NAD-dependent epimerase/dehydratase [Bacillus methanolicus PB1]
MKALITGITGFVGKHLEAFLQDKAEVYGTSRNSRSNNHIFQLDLLSETETFHLIKKIKPTHIFHLAGLSNVKDSWEHKADFIQANVIGTVHLLEAVRQADDQIKVMTVGSSEEYGIVPEGAGKIREEAPLHPISPYGLSKCAISMLVKLYYKSYGLNVTHARPFNHIGPGQRLGFVSTDFAHQIALINKGIVEENKIKIGNLQTVRDFTDVRDIVEAYYEIGRYGKAGEVYNVCTGEGVAIQNLLEILLSFSNKKIEPIVDPNRMRAAEIPRLVGDPEKLIKLTGWKPKRKLEDTLRDIYNNWLYKL